MVTASFASTPMQVLFDHKIAVQLQEGGVGNVSGIKCPPTRIEEWHEVIERINDDLTLIVARKCISIQDIDKGNAIVVMLEGASSEVVSLILPRKVAQEMASDISQHVAGRLNLGRDDIFD
ncbi:hypothetical protein ACXIT0_12140 [Methylorubrum extorquens]